MPPLKEILNTESTKSLTKAKKETIGLKKTEDKLKDSIFSEKEYSEHKDKATQKRTESEQKNLLSLRERVSRSIEQAKQFATKNIMGIRPKKPLDYKIGKRIYNDSAEAKLSEVIVKEYEKNQKNYEKIGVKSEAEENIEVKYPKNIRLWNSGANTKARGLYTIIDTPDKNKDKVYVLKREIDDHILTYTENNLTDALQKNFAIIKEEIEEKKEVAIPKVKVSGFEVEAPEKNPQIKNLSEAQKIMKRADVEKRRKNELERYRDINSEEFKKALEYYKVQTEGELKDKINAQYDKELSESGLNKKEAENKKIGEIESKLKKIA